MTYPVFASGDVLNASDMNAVGLWLVKTQTIGTAVSSVTVTGAFSADYDNYRLVCNHTSFSTTANVLVQLGTGTATTTNYNGYIRTAYNPWGTATPADVAVTNAFQATSSTGAATSFSMDIFAPNLARVTYAGGHFANQSNGGYLAGRQSDSTQFTSLHVSVTAGTMTGGPIKIYGYQN